jgi:hypothetical protein
VADEGKGKEVIIGDAREERQGDSQGSAQVADNPPSEAGRSGLFQKSPTLEARHSDCFQRVLQHESDVADGPVFEAGRSIDAERAPNSSERGILEKFRDLDKLGQEFISVDHLEDINTGDDKTPRLAFVNKTLEADPRMK